MEARRTGVSHMGGAAVLQLPSKCLAGRAGGANLVLHYDWSCEKVEFKAGAVQKCMVFLAQEDLDMIFAGVSIYMENAIFSRSLLVSYLTACTL
jgi:hypothetical protein